MDYFKTTGCCTGFPSVFFTSRFLQNFNFADNRLHPAIPLGTLKFSHILFIGIACLRRQACLYRHTSLVCRPVGAKTLRMFSLGSVLILRGMSLLASTLIGVRLKSPW